MSRTLQRMPLVDGLKALASQLIVLHHLAAYGPLSEAVQELLPGVMAWLYDYGRIAVQVFLVIGGFLAARGLAPEGVATFRQPLQLIQKRYLRLAVPYLSAVVLAIFCAALARQWMIDDSIPERATFPQLVAHALLLSGLLGYDALSAGVWYVAIDFQLFVLLLLALWVGQRAAGFGRALRHGGLFLVGALALASLFWFNRDAAWDNWALYFFGSYGLGAAAWWASGRGRLHAWLGAIACVTIAALVLDFRLRIAVALVVALGLGFARRSGWLVRFPEFRPVAFLGRVSYSVFLVHFPLCLVINALFLEYDFESPRAALAAMGLTWAASIAGGALFFRWVESPAASQRILALPGWLLAQGRAGFGRLLPALARDGSRS